MSAQPSKYETVSKKGPKVALGGSDARLVFRKRVYRHVHDIPNDPVEYHLLYAEAVNKVVKVRLYNTIFSNHINRKLKSIPYGLTLLLAHLSRRLMGELIVYQSVRCLSSIVRPSIHNFKHLLL